MRLIYNDRALSILVLNPCTIVAFKKVCLKVRFTSYPLYRTTIFQFSLTRKSVVTDARFSYAFGFQAITTI